MKQYEKATELGLQQKKSACLKCVQCQKKESEESRPVKLAPKNEPNGLYDAEALSYYYYFSTPYNKAS